MADTTTTTTPSSGTSIVAPVPTTTTIIPVPTTGTGTSAVVEPTTIAPPPNKSFRHSAPPPPVIIAPPYPYPQYIGGVPILQTLYDGLTYIPNTLFPNPLIIEDSKSNQKGANQDVILTKEIDDKNSSIDTKKVLVMGAVAVGLYLIVKNLKK